MKKSQRGEIITLLMLGTLVVLGVSAFISTVFLKNKATTSSKAEVAPPACTSCVGNQCVYHPELDCNTIRGGTNVSGSNCCENTGCTLNSQCGGVNPTPCPGKVDASGACNPACCDPKLDPKNPDANCPSGQTCTHANGYCQGGFSCEPKGSLGKSICTQNQCAWILCDPNDSSCCSSQSDTRCQYCKSNSECVGVNPTPPTSTASKCFSLSAQVSQKPVQGGVQFSIQPTITNLAKIGAHIQMWVNGNRTLFNNWNKYPGTIDFVPGQEYSGSPVTVLKGRSASITYTVKEDECNTLGNQDSLSCTFQVDNAGNPYSSCGLTNPAAVISGSVPQESSTPTSGKTANQPCVAPATLQYLGSTLECVTPIPVAEGLQCTPPAVPQYTGAEMQCVTPIPVPTEGTKSVSTCINYGVNPPQKDVACPFTRTEICSRLISRRLASGTRYVKIDCGNDANKNSCSYSCKKVDDLVTNNYSGACNSPDTCLGSFDAAESTVNATINATLINCAGKRNIASIFVRDADSGKTYSSKTYNQSVSYNIIDTLSFQLPKYPLSTVNLQSFVNLQNVSNPNDNVGYWSENKESINSVQGGSVSLQISYTCQ